MKILALVILLSSLYSLTMMEVVDTFEKKCSSFFVQNPKKTDHIIPTIFAGGQYKKICQYWKKKYRFATVYDTKNRIPVYSAYTFLQETETVRADKWKIEPQLENIQVYKSMIDMINSPDIKQPIVVQITNQAVTTDYTNSSYTRGHVFPRKYAADQDQADSTFTLTNIAPQTNDSNQQWDKEVETPMLGAIGRICSLKDHPAYIVTGVVPGKKWIRITKGLKVIPNGINVPSHFWSAFCCTDRNNKNKLVFRAYIAKLENFQLQTPDLADLNKQLSSLYGKHFNVFPGLQ